MTTITTTTTEISLAKLTLSPANVRRTGAGAGIEALASSIRAHGLLQADFRRGGTAPFHRDGERGPVLTMLTGLTLRCGDSGFGTIIWIAA